MLYQFLPRLSDDEYTALEKSILENGVQVPIVVDENRAVIDGHHRKEIADRHGLDCPRRFVYDRSDEQKRTLALSLNLDRRHLTREQKRDLVQKSLKADPHLSDRQHAERTAVAHTTVSRARAELESTGALHQSETRLSADGRERPSSQPPRVNVATGEVFDAAESEDMEDGPSVETAAADLQPSAKLAEGAPAPESASKARRRPLPDAFFEKRYDLSKVVASLHRLTLDDRFPQNAEKVATAHRSDLIRSRDLLQQVIDQLPETEVTA